MILPPIRRNLRLIKGLEWSKNKRPFVHSGVRNGEYRIFTCIAVDQQHIHVKRARSKTFIAHTVSGLFAFVCKIKDLQRHKIKMKAHNAIEIWTLVRWTTNR